MSLLFLFLTTFLVSTTTALNIKCNFQQKSYSPVGDFYTCDNAVINPPEEDLVVDGVQLVAAVNEFGDKVYGTHANDDEGTPLTNVNVEGYATNQEMLYFPENLSRVFGNLKAISLDQTGLSYLTQRDLQPFPQLQFLQVVQGLLQSLSSDLFRSSENLKFINFEANQIEFIGSGLLEFLPSTGFNFHENVCVDVDSTNAMFTNTQPDENQEPGGSSANSAILSNLCTQGMYEKLPTTTVETTACPSQQDETLIQELQDAIAENDRVAAELQSKVIEILTLNSEFFATVIEKETVIMNLQYSVAEKDQQIADLQEIKQRVIDFSNGFCEAPEEES